MTLKTLSNKLNEWYETRTISLFVFMFLVQVVLGIIFFSYSKIIAYSILVSSFGALLNTIAVGFNNGRMPVWNFYKYSPEKYKIHVPMTDSHKMKFLCDVIPISWKGSRASIGDLIIWCSQSVMITAWVDKVFWS